MQPPGDLHGLQASMVGNTIFAQAAVFYKALHDLGCMGFG
jgi:hypothetical protein